MRYFLASLKLSIKKFLIYRTTSLLIIVFSTLFLITELLSIEILYTMVDEIGGFSRERMVILLALTNIITSLYEFIFIDQHEELAYKIVDGELDYTLLRPVNSLLASSVKSFDLASLFNLIIPITLIKIALVREGIVLDIFKIIIIFIFILNGVIQYYLINQLIANLSFKLEKSNKLISLSEYFMDFAIKPQSIFPKPIKFIFKYIIPMFLISQLPLSILYGDIKIKDMILSIMYTVVFFALTLFSWKRSLVHYQSASS
ncbi:ABC transporter permease [Anaerococcus sp.]|uniref:ABC transporter permease n=1 Tax=Anaerococcus sp. TaxID=1872515 RepID=UPI0027B8E406|nr:ABC-2 family transporter protein [Anaerococcus sp.]